MATATRDASTTTGMETGELYRHTKRPEWGLAILAWDRGDSRGYQFEDGRFRKIRKGYYRLLEPVDEFDAPEEMIRASLAKASAEAEDSSSSIARKPICSFREQVDLFLRLYPQGFEDPEWLSQHRGEPGEGALKRHRDPVVAEAAQTLSATSCNAMIAEGRQEELADSIIELLAGTSLVPISHVKLLRRLDDEEKATYADSVVDVLHGGEHFSRRFRRYLDVLSDLLGHPSWRVATALPAIVHPGKHISVRRSAFSRQAGSIAPAARYSRRPTAAAYRNYRRLAMGVRQRLVEAGHEPRDLLDVHDFIWTTMRKSALEHLGVEGA